MTESFHEPANGLSENLREGTSTITVTETAHVPTEPTLQLRLKKSRSSREVHWAEGTVDNEGMDKKKSKCCCIYEKPKAFDESSSESEDECDHCRGHVEKKRSKKLKLTVEPESISPTSPELPTPSTS